MGERLEKLKAMLKKEQERRIKLNNRIAILERRIQEESAAEVADMVRTANVTPEQLAILLRQAATMPPDPRLRCPQSAQSLIRRKSTMKFKKIGALLLSAVLCIGMAAPAFAYGDDTAPVEQPVLPEAWRKMLSPSRMKPPAH